MNANELIFDVLSPFIGDCHPAAGVAGLLLALESLPKEQDVFEWSVDGSAITVSWKGDFVESWDYLIRHSFQLTDGIITLPGSNTPILTHNAAIDTILQSPQTRPQIGTATVFLPSQYGNFKISTIKLESYIQQKFAAKLVRGNVRVKRVESIEAVSWLIPNCTGGMAVRLETAIAALFSPLTWGFYDIVEPVGSKFRRSTALICPIIHNLERVDFFKPLTPEESIAGSLEDACLHFADLNKCSVHAYQYYSERADRVAKIIAALNCAPHSAYNQLRQNFPNSGGLRSDDTVFINSNPVRALAAKNLVGGKVWYDDISRLGFDTLSFQRGALNEQLGKLSSRQQRWKEKTGFESQDRRKGYKAGYNAFKRGKKEVRPDLPDSEWAKGYRQGFEAAMSKKLIE